MIVLLQPPGACSAFTRSASLYPPLGICQLAATLSPERCVVLDADAEKLSEEAAVAATLAHHPIAVGMTVTSGTLDLVQRYAAAFAARGIDVVVGGPHASLAPHEVLWKCPSARYVVRGEPESVFPEMIARLERNVPLDDLAGVCTRASGGLRVSPEVLRVSDEELAVLPFPRLEDLPLGAWWCPDAWRRPMVTMASTRGCPHQCGFCSSPTLLGRKVRSVPVDRVLGEIERLVTVSGVREISFVDDVFTISRRRCLELCRGLVERRIDLSWFCNARADQVTPELAEALAKGGCHQVYLGFESGDQRVLDAINKGITVEGLVEGAELLRRAGVGRSIGFVIGLPGESDETIAKTIEVAHRVRPERIQFTRFTPLAGSPLAGGRRDELVGFHGRGDDQVERWIQRCYAAVGPDSGWGRPSI